MINKKPAYNDVIHNNDLIFLFDIGYCRKFIIKSCYIYLHNFEQFCCALLIICAHVNRKHETNKKIIPYSQILCYTNTLWLWCYSILRAIFESERMPYGSDQSNETAFVPYGIVQYLLTQFIHTYVRTYIWFVHMYISTYRTGT